MRRLVITAAILLLGTIGSWRLHDWAAQERAAASAADESWAIQTQRLAQTQVQRDDLFQRVREIKRMRTFRAEPPLDLTLANLVLSNRPGSLSPEQREHLLDELGFNWNSTGDYLVVSKDSLRKINLFNATRQNRLTDTLCNILAVTSDERGAVEGVMARLAGEYATWAASHFQRTEPAGEVLAQYSLPAAPEFSKTLHDAFSSAIISAVGPERGELLLSYVGQWMNGSRMSGSGASVLTVKRPEPGQEWLPFELKTADGGTMSAVIGPYQPFPDTFLPLFPGGWAELANREGFQLPKGFKRGE